MIVLAILVIGFLLSEPVFGLQVIGAFDLLQYWLWFVAILIGCVGVLLIGTGGFLGNYLTEQMAAYKTLATTIGGILGTIVAVIIAGIAFFNLWLSYYIIDHTPADAKDWAALPDNTQYAIIAFGIMWLIGMFNSFRAKTNQNKD